MGFIEKPMALARDSLEGRGWNSEILIIWLKWKLALFSLGVLVSQKLTRLASFTRFTNFIIFTNFTRFSFSLLLLVLPIAAIHTISGETQEKSWNSSPVMTNLDLGDKNMKLVCFEERVGIISDFLLLAVQAGRVAFPLRDCYWAGHPS